MPFNFNKSLLLGSFLILCFTAQAQRGNPQRLDLAYGKCQKSCLLSHLYDRSEIAIPSYIGNDENIINNYVKDTIIVTKRGSTKWVKKRRRGRDVPEEERYIWCLVEEPKEEIQIDWYLTDTTVTTEYVVEYYSTKELTDIRGFREWKEVVCENQIDSHFMNTVRDALGMSDYDSKALLDEGTEKALREYQEYHGLPIGGLNFETLEHLGIDY